MELIKIEVTKNQFASSKDARKNGRIPMVYYAKGIEPVNFSVEYQEFRRAYKKAGRSSIMTLTDEKGSDYQAIVHELQYHPVTDLIIHVDLKAVRKDEKIETEVPIVLVGEAPAVRELGGMIVRNKDRVWVKCLPKDLPHEIEVDISGLVDFNSSLSVGDVKVPDTILITDAPEISLVVIAAPRQEDEPVTAAPAAEITPEVKAEGEEKKAE